MEKHKNSVSQHKIGLVGTISLVEFCFSADFASNRHTFSASQHTFDFISTQKLLRSDMHQEFQMHDGSRSSFTFAMIYEVFYLFSVVSNSTVLLSGAAGTM